MLPTLVFASTLVVAGFALRQMSDDPPVRRRALLIVLLAATALLVKVGLESIPETVLTTATTPQGQSVETVAPNPTYEVARVAFLATALLGFLLMVVTAAVDLVLVRRLGLEVPRIVRDTGLAAVFFLGVLIILYYETDLDVTGLFTTAGVVSVVIGLALQNTLDNVFSGLALQSERPFAVGDWIQFDGREGTVTDITWRSTKIRTRENDLVIVPNSVLSSGVVVNHSAPTSVHALTVSVGAAYQHPPAEVREALEEAARQTEGVLRRPPPEIRTEAYGDSSITYAVRFWIRGYAAQPEVKSDLTTHIWYAFRRHGIQIPFPIRTVYKTEVTEEGKAEERRRETQHVLDRLNQVELFDDVPAADLREVARFVRALDYFTGETIIWQGAEGHALYIIDEGRVEVVLERNGRRQRLAELGPGAFVGEMSLMTGDPHTATVTALEPTRCLVVGQDGIRGPLERHPQLAERITETLVRRRSELDETDRHLQQAPEEGRPRDEHRQLLARIRGFFGIGGAG